MPVTVAHLNLTVQTSGASFDVSASNFLDETRRRLATQLSGGERGSRTLVTRPVIPASMSRALGFYDGPEAPLRTVELVPVDEDADEW